MRYPAVLVLLHEASSAARAMVGRASARVGMGDCTGEGRILLPNGLTANILSILVDFS